MESLFFTILNMSITGSWLVLVVMVLRLLLRKAPKALAVMLWALVGIRLICPWMVESPLSMIPSVEPIPENILYAQTPAIDSGVAALDSVVNPVISSSFAPLPSGSRNLLQTIALAASMVWIIGMAGMLLYAVISYLRIHHKVREAAFVKENIWVCDHIDTPFVFGLLRPRIYLPSNMEKPDADYVIAHETAHLKRLDHLWKPLGFLLLTIYWFHPLIWAAYILLCRDIELACDEKVIANMGTESIQSYSNALINCSVSQKMITSCPLAFGEVGVKGRVRSILHYKKPALWILLAALAVSIAAAVCFLTNPPICTEILGANYETGKCRFSLVVSEQKETNINTLMFGIHSNGDVYKDFGGGRITFLGTLQKSEFTQADLNRIMQEENVPEIPLGTIVNAYEIPGSSEEGEDIFLQNKAGDVFYIKRLVDGGILWVFELFQNHKIPLLSLEEESDPSNDPADAPNSTERALKEKYPQYFDCTTDKGLEIYIWQMAANSYFCGLLPGKNSNYTDSTLMRLVPATIEEMRIIVASYHLPQEEVVILPFRYPYSSYYYEIDDAYCQNLEDLFWSDSAMVPPADRNPMVDSVIFDLDDSMKLHLVP